MQIEGHEPELEDTECTDHWLEAVGIQASAVGAKTRVMLANNQESPTFSPSSLTLILKKSPESIQTLGRIEKRNF